LKSPMFSPEESVGSSLGEGLAPETAMSITSPLKVVMIPQYAPGSKQRLGTTQPSASRPVNLAGSLVTTPR